MEVEHSRYFKTIKRFYDNGTYGINEVMTFVENEKPTSITREEFKEITGEDYVN